MNNETIIEIKGRLNKASIWKAEYEANKERLNELTDVIARKITENENAAIEAAFEAKGLSLVESIRKNAAFVGGGTQKTSAKAQGVRSMKVGSYISDIEEAGDINNLLKNQAGAE